MKILHKIAFVLVIVGAVNWLLLALTGWEVGQLLGGMDNMVSKAVYVLVGLSGIYLVTTHMKDCKHCDTTAKTM